MAGTAAERAFIVLKNCTRPFPAENSTSGVTKQIMVISVAISVMGREMLTETSRSRERGSFGQTTGLTGMGLPPWEVAGIRC